MCLNNMVKISPLMPRCNQRGISFAKKSFIIYSVCSARALFIYQIVFMESRTKSWTRVVLEHK